MCIGTSQSWTTMRDGRRPYSNNINLNWWRKRAHRSCAVTVIDVAPRGDSTTSFVRTATDSGIYLFPGEFFEFDRKNADIPIFNEFWDFIFQIWLQTKMRCRKWDDAIQIKFANDSISCLICHSFISFIHIFFKSLLKNLLIRFLPILTLFFLNVYIKTILHQIIKYNVIN